MFKIIPIQYRIIAVIVLLLGLFAGGYWRGHAAADQSWRLKDSRRVAQENHVKLQSQIMAHNKEREQASKVAALDARYQQEITDAQTEINRLRRDVRAGLVRLSVKSAKPAALGAYDSTTASGADAAARCELDTTTADDLIGITSDGDAAIRQLTALQDYVHDVCVNQE